MKNVSVLNEYPLILDAKDVADFMEKSIPYTYFLMARKDFPSAEIGGRVLVYKKLFIDWLEQ